MSSAAAGTVANFSGEENGSKVTGPPTWPPNGISNLGGTSVCSAEAEQGEGPAAASATSSAQGQNGGSVMAVSSVASMDYASAACPVGAVAVGPFSAAASSEVGSVSVSPSGAAAAANAANGTKAVATGEATSAEQQEILNLLREVIEKIAAGGTSVDSSGLVLTGGNSVELTGGNSVEPSAEPVAPLETTEAIAPKRPARKAARSRRSRKSAATKASGASPDEE